MRLSFDRPARTSRGAGYDDSPCGLDTLGLNAGKRARLHRILFGHGLRNGTALFLPYDQGLEHGPRDFADNPASGRSPVRASPRRRGRLQRHRAGGRSGSEVLLGVRG